MNASGERAVACWRRAAFVLSLLACTVSAQSISVERVADVCPGGCSGIDNNFFYANAAGATRFYFAGTDPAHGNEPWVTDGTTAGTWMLADIVPGVAGSDSYGYVTIGDTFFFSAFTPAAHGWGAGTRLWRSDGTPGGTAPVDLPGSNSAFAIGYQISGYRTSRGLVMPSTQGIWWVPSDHSPPRKLADGYLVGERVVEWNGAIYFIAVPCSQFCNVGGQPADVYRLEPGGQLERIGAVTVGVDTNGSGTPFAQITAGTTGVFLSPRPADLWFTDGQGPPQFIRNFPNTRGLRLNDQAGDVGAYLLSWLQNDHNAALWFSDGTATGTKPLTHFPRFRQLSSIYKFGVANDALLLRIPRSWYTPSGYVDVPDYSLYADIGVLDASASFGVRSLRAFAHFSQTVDIINPVPIERGILFQIPGNSTDPPHTTMNSLWATDGTTGGTQRVEWKEFGEVSPYWFMAHVNGWTYFRGWSQAAGYELYRMRFVAGQPPTFPTVDVTEYYHAGFDHYFVTGDPAEKAKLDSGSPAGWRRTGFQFSAYAPGSGALGVSPVCRFYGRPEAGLDSHFYSASPQECNDVETRFGNAWIKESANVFEVATPNAQTGWCTGATVPLYRAYNGRKDANHRYSVHAADQKAMQLKGWIPEGSTTAGNAMCVLTNTRPQ